MTVNFTWVANETDWNLFRVTISHWDTMSPDVLSSPWILETAQLYIDPLKLNFSPSALHSYICKLQLLTRSINVVTAGSPFKNAI